MKKVLMTGFAPFGGETLNSAWEAVRSLGASRTGHFSLEVRLLPTVFGKSADVLRQAIVETRPDVVICVGQAGGRADIGVERIAINLDDARIPDNEGNQPIDRPVAANGPAAYWSTLPVKTIARRIREAGIPASVSHSAGTFVCNHLFYALQHMAVSEFPDLRSGFIHVPYLPTQTAERPGVPCMSLENIASALEIAAAASVLDEQDAASGSEGRIY